MDGFRINENFAKKYNQYREKEEFQKLKSRYGDVEDSSESESEDDNAEALTPGLERDFLRTLAYLKNKDPAIYDKSKKFYEETDTDNSPSATDTEKDIATKPMFLKDYERKVILENEGRFVEDQSDDEEHEESRAGSPSYHQEQMQLKEEFQKALKENEDGDLLTRRHKSSNDKEKEEEEFRRWLKTPEAQLDQGEGSEIKGAEKMKAVAEEVAPLKQYWTDPKLDEGEKFLRDYILERKYLAPNADGELPTYDEIVGAESDKGMSDTEDELFEKKSELFEHKYNFRFEEPDREFIKSYPRTIGTSVRRKEDTRKKKRDEKKKKDEGKKRKKEEELKRLKSLKKKEILDKIKKLQEATGNKDMAFNKADLEVEFDPDEHDKRMQEIFSKYDEDFDEEKPVFSDLEEEMYWDEEQGYGGGDYEADCENPDFIMDCDYDATEHRRIKEQRKDHKNKKENPHALENKKNMKKSPFYDSVAKPKPTFDPKEKSFENYLDEYYALDYEDLIGDLPCRFKYRQVVPNDFGLSTDEILSATDRELNTWCSLKRTVQYRKEDDEKMDVKKYKRKGSNVWKKARVLKSVYKMPGEDADEEAQDSKDQNNNNLDGQEGSKVLKKKKMNSRKRRRLKEREAKLRLLEEEDVPSTSSQYVPDSSKLNHQDEQPRKKFKSDSFAPKMKKKPNPKRNSDFDKVSKLSDERLKAYGLQPKKFLKKMKYNRTSDKS